VQIDDWNQMAVRTLLADAARSMAPTEFEGGRANRETVPDTISNARKNYIDFVRRGRPLIMSEADQTVLQKQLDRLRERLRFFGEAV
jgi:hypothetical protein